MAPLADTMIWNGWPGRMLLGMFPDQKKLKIPRCILTMGPSTPNWIVDEVIEPWNGEYAPDTVRFRRTVVLVAGCEMVTAIPDMMLFLMVEVLSKPALG